jgi:hypothetical protein
LHGGTFEHPGLGLEKTEGNGKTKEICKVFEEQKLDAMAITELHNSQTLQEVNKQVITVFIEQFVFVLGATSGWMLSRAMYDFWQSSGGRLANDADSWVAITLHVKGEDISLVAGYVPGHGEIGRKKLAYAAAESLRSRLAKKVLFAADWQGHVGNDFPTEDNLQGEHSMSQPTTVGGRLQRQWAKKLQLRCVDSYHAVQWRGT